MTEGPTSWHTELLATANNRLKYRVAAQLKINKSVFANRSSFLLKFQWILNQPRFLHPSPVVIHVGLCLIGRKPGCRVMTATKTGLCFSIRYGRQADSGVTQTNTALLLRCIVLSVHTAHCTLNTALHTAHCLVQLGWRESITGILFAADFYCTEDRHSRVQAGNILRQAKCTNFEEKQSDWFFFISNCTFTFVEIEDWKQFF